MGTDTINNPKYFFTHFNTRGIFSLLENSAIAHYKKLMGLDFVTRRGMDHRRLDLYVLLAAFQVFSCYVVNLFKFRNGRPYYLFNVKDVEVGKYITSSVLRDVRTNQSHLRFVLSFHVSMVRSMFVLGAAFRNARKIDAIYLGDLFYLDGIWIDFFLQRKDVHVYLNDYTYGALCVTKLFKNLSALTKNLEASRASHRLDAHEEVSSYMEKRLRDPEGEISYYGARSDGSGLGLATPKSSKTSVIVYAHSFTDAQMARGYDGFKSVYDWLNFTLRVLGRLNQTVDVFLKVHPNFYAFHTESGEPHAAVLDRAVWQYFTQRISKKITVIDSAISNYEFLNDFSKERTVLISHHGNAIVEGAFLGYDSISSMSSPWSENYEFSRVWNGRKQYRHLLLQLRAPHIQTKSQFESVRKFISNAYLQDRTSPSNDSFDLNVISKHCKVPVSELMSFPFASINCSAQELEDAEQELSSNITIVN